MMIILSDVGELSRRDIDKLNKGGIAVLISGKNSLEIESPELLEVVKLFIKENYKVSL